MKKKKINPSDKIKNEPQDEGFININVPITNDDIEKMDNIKANNNFYSNNKSNNEDKIKHYVGDYNKIKIQEQVENSAKEHLGIDFNFRPKQKEAIVDTIYNWLNGKQDVICSAPTGSGKSIIALLVAAVLSEYYNKTGYILISDLSLIEQYERDVNRSFRDWSVIKGQQTYKCDVNRLPFNMGLCKMKGCGSYNEIKRKFPSCSRECQYILEREKAIASNVLICTYSFWLIQQNLVKKKLGDDAPFLSRDFTICDECHNMVSIVQNHFSPKFSNNDIKNFDLILRAVNEEDDYIQTLETLNSIRKKIALTSDNFIIMSLLKDYVNTLKNVGDVIDTIKRGFSNKGDKHVSLSKEDRILAYCCSSVEEHILAFADYFGIIYNVGAENIVKNDQENSDEIIFNCIDESYLMYRCFHQHCGCKMYMSATIGEHAAFAKDCGFNDYFSIDIPSSFGFVNSPIFYISDYKLSYNERELCLPRVLELIEGIVDMYSGKRGIIQTGSYQFSQYLMENVNNRIRRRLIGYDGSKEKQESLDFFKQCNDKILVGPSLIEGLSFDDDLSRFQIIMKVPYPSIKDKFVAAKQKVNPEWYSNTTAISVLQGVGRSIRNEKDWCVTFILDGCFSSLFKNSYAMFPEHFTSRIQQISPYTILLNK